MLFCLVLDTESLGIQSGWQPGTTCISFHVSIKDQMNDELTFCPVLLVIATLRKMRLSLQQQCQQ